MAFVLSVSLARGSVNASFHSQCQSARKHVSTYIRRTTTLSSTRCAIDVGVDVELLLSPARLRHLAATEVP